MSWIFSHGGVFPVRRGHQDEEAFISAFKILERGGAIVMYCEGGRSRTGKLADRRGPGSGGSRSSRARRSCRSRSSAPTRFATGSGCQFPKVTVQYGKPFRFEVVADTAREQQQQAADYIFGRMRELHGELTRVGSRGARRLARERAARATP